MKVNVYSIDGEVKEEMELPAIFDEVYRPDLIKRAVLSAQSARVQPWGNDPMAGKRTSAKGWGSGRGTARVPRIKNGSKAAFVPMAIGGRQAHPTRAEKNHHEKINIKERRFAIRSAVAATTNKEIVENRGHKVADLEQVPIIVEDDLESVKTAKQSREIFEKIGVYDTEANARLALDYVSYIINSGEPKLNIPTVKFVEGLKAIDSNIGNGSESAIAKLLKDIEKGFGGGFNK